MGKLFRVDQLMALADWKAKQNLLILREEDLGFDYLVEYRGIVEFFFYPKNEEIKKFFPKVKIFYNDKTKRVIACHCEKCETTKCSHFYSVLLYAYSFLDDSLIEKKENVKNYTKSFLTAKDKFANLLICLKNLQNKNTENFSIVLQNMLDVDIRKIISDFYASLENKNLSEKNVGLDFIRRNESFSQNELLLLFLWKYKLRYFSFKQTFVLLKKDFAKLIPILKIFENKIIFFEKKGNLVFSKNKLSLNFTLKRKSEEIFLLSAKPDFLPDDIYFSSEIYFLCKNEILSVNFPFDENLAKKIFLGSLCLNLEDLVYFNEIFFSKMILLGHKIEIAKDISLPKVYNSHTANLVKIGENDENSYFLEIFLQFGNKYFPIKFISEKSNLYYYKESWFYIKEKDLKGIKDFFLMFKKNLNEKIIFPKNKFEYLKKIIYEKYNNAFWLFEFPDNLKENLIEKVNLIPEIVINDENKWFEYKINYKAIDEEIFSMNDLNTFFNSKEKFLKLKNGKILFVENKEELLQINKYFINNKNKGICRLNYFEIPKFYNFFNKHKINISNDEKIFQVNKALQNRRLSNNISLPENLKISMRHYQKEGFAWLEMLKSFHFNGVLADEMGLGKTVQALSVISANLNEKINLIACPKTLIFVWANEINKFSPNLKYLTYDGDKTTRKEKSNFEDFDLIIASYSILMKDIDFFEKFSYNYFVIDEAQYIKNHKAIRTKAVNSIQADYKIALTGTPIENSPEDIWSIFNFLMPSFFPSFREFKKNIQRDKNYLNNIKTMISPYLLRRKKEQILKELPLKQEQIILSKMSLIQDFYYMKILKEIKENFSNKKWNYFNILTALTKLRQICNHPYLIDKNVRKNIHSSGKATLLMELILNLLENKRKVLVFSQFLKMLEIIKNELQFLKIKFSYLDGKTKNREKVIEEFNQNEDISVFLISLKTGNFGINLTSADTVILVDPWWNPMIENQAIDRAHRIGQTKKLLVYRLITKGTVEEKIYNMQKEKKLMFNNLIENIDLELKNFSFQEIMNLFEE